MGSICCVQTALLWREGAATGHKTTRQDSKTWSITNLGSEESQQFVPAHHLTDRLQHHVVCWCRRSCMVSLGALQLHGIHSRLTEAVMSVDVVEVQVYCAMVSLHHLDDAVLDA
eukprot:s5165_g2.t1